MYAHAEHTPAPKSSVSNNVSATAVSPAILPVDNRPEAVTQRRLQQLANESVVQRVAVVQRMPESEALTKEEEKGISDAITQKNYALAIQLLEQTDFYTQGKPDNVRSLQYSAQGANYGQAVQDYNDQDRVDILLEPAAFKSIPILVSTLHHETIHAEQYKQKSQTGQALKDNPRIPGQAREASKYIEAAQEIETYAAEIELAESFGTNYDEKFLTARGVSLSNFYLIVFEAGKKSKTSKMGQYLEKVKPIVRAAYENLESLGINTDGFDWRGLSDGSKKRKKQPDAAPDDATLLPSNDNNAPQQQPPVAVPPVTNNVPPQQQPVPDPNQQP